MVGEDDAALGIAAGLEEVTEAGGVEDIVAEDEADVVGADELLTKHEGLGEAVRDSLLDEVETAADARAVAEHLAETRQILGRRDNQDLADAREHEHGQRIIDHRLVVHR